MSIARYKKFIAKFQNKNLDESLRPAITGKGQSMERHKKSYVDPHVGSSTPTHTVRTAVAHLNPGDQVRIHGSHIENGEHHVTVSGGSSKKKVKIPVSKLSKPGSMPKNKGFDYETGLVKRLHKHGIAKPETAGATGGNDFSLINKKRKTTHKGRGAAKENTLAGEAKAGKTAAFGQLTLHHDDERGWHIPEAQRKLRPRFAKKIEKIKIGGKSIFEHMNETHHPDNELPKGRTKAPDVKADHDDLQPAHEYLRDHHVDVVQVGGHGLYHTHDSGDPTGHKLPGLTGKGQWRVRQKTDNPRRRTVQFMAKHIDASHTDLDNDDHVKKFAKTLGH